MTRKVRIINNLQEFDVCFPTDPKIRVLWEKKLETEQAKMKNEFKEKGKILKIINNSTRINILLTLLPGAERVSNLVKKLEIKFSAISYHISLLEKNNLIKTPFRDGATYPQLTDYGRSIINWFSSIPIQN
jgi:DNA-binding transcriptional ArsR family regulator